MNPFLIQIPFLPEQASSFASEMDLFYLLLIALTGFFTVLIGAAALYFLIKYRRRSRAEVPEQIEGHLKLEITWTVVPFVISMFIFAWGAKLYYQMYTPPTDALEIFVTGKQWMWRAQHPDGQREINELHVPLGRRVKLTMTSEDVIHSYYIPAFRTKTDVVPGRYTTSWFTPIKAGTYHLFCAEYCGTQHSGMIGKVVVMDPPDYEAWLRNVPRDKSPAEAGQQLFTSLACSNCHLEDNKGRGPSLQNLFGKEVKLANGAAVKADEAYLRESILNPGAKTVAGYANDMPTFQGLVTEEQVAMIIQYIKSVGPKQGAAAPAAAVPATQGVGRAAAPQAAKPAAPQVEQQKQD
ncbi:MAG TPA: cytochrome c oxidase subunit II [Blastocatellia bacterium]|jgi:cytochrome c oxidase subunit 2|nr:cytochrome c oxidase subunit II [Blastocatellia bacterium]